MDHQRDEAPKPSDVGFGYVADYDASNSSSSPVEQYTTYKPSFHGPQSPLKSALKSPGEPGRTSNPLSPTFREEQALEMEEVKTDIQQAKDLKVKFRVRAAKMFLRGVNFSCSLIVLSMLSTTFAIFNETRSIPPRNNLPPWATNTNPWAQVALLVISCISLIFSVIIFYAYWKGGHQRAKKTTVYYTVFCICFFSFSIVMWAVGAGILHFSRANGNGKDVWGWACKDNQRSQLFSQDVKYGLICTLQGWSLMCCIIEIVVETLTILIYAIVFYRFRSARRLRKSMVIRDKARSDLYLARLRAQSAPNTPGFVDRVHSLTSMNPESDVEEGHATHYTTQYVDVKQEGLMTMSPKPFQLQPPPIRVGSATPSSKVNGLEHVALGATQQQELVQAHVPAAPGEQTYEAVPIPGSYASPLSSPSVLTQNVKMAWPTEAGI